jgi:hypothetical protein
LNDNIYRSVKNGFPMILDPQLTERRLINPFLGVLRELPNVHAQLPAISTSISASCPLLPGGSAFSKAFDRPAFFSGLRDENIHDQWRHLSPLR